MRTNRFFLIASLLAGLLGCGDDGASRLPGCLTDADRAPERAVRSVPCPDDAARVRDEICRAGEWVPDGECHLPHECAPGDEDTLNCGLNRRGRALRACEDGVWTAPGLCDEIDACEDGEVRNTLGDATCEPCGLNGRGVRTQSCRTGQWDCGPCQEPDDCVDGDRQTRPCAEGSPIEQLRVCANGHWTTWSACPPEGACIDGDVHAASCGHNGRGRRRSVCRDGVWLAGGCDDADACVDDALDRRRCGLNGNGVQDRRCIDGQWPAWNNAACDDPDACVYGDVQRFECGGGRLRVRRCLVGQWSQWGPCFAPDPCMGDGDCDVGDWCAPIGVCLAPSCQDGIRNGTEAGIDCGGPCAQCPADERCNGADDDRDGVSDEGLELGEACQPDGTPDGCVGTRVCGDDGAVVCLPPAGILSDFDGCDGFDNNCDGTIDEDGDRDCVESLPGTLDAMCVDGQCLAAVCLPGDSNADGDPANGCEASACTAETVGADAERLGQACTRPVGDGGARCLGVWDCDLDDLGEPVVLCRVAGAPGDGPLACGACAPGDFLPAAESCNEADDDCDGAIDEDFDDLGAACAPVGPGCAPGVVVCLADGTGTFCEPPEPPAGAVETCNALDDDCDGATDEACPGGPNVEAGYCVDGQTCAVDRCDPGWADLDDDPGNGCEAPIDCDAVGEPCLAQRDPDAPFERCGRLGRVRCVLDDGVVSSVCVADDADSPLVGGRPEACNDWDDDCDGIADEDVAPDGPCTAGIGGCERGGLLVCVDGAFACDAVPGEPAGEVCDAVDDDCDDDIDDAPAEPCYDGPPTTRGVGQCVGGARACVDGAYEAACAGQVLPSEELCDSGLDEDCDGRTDEDRCAWPCDGDNTPPCNGCRGVLVPDGMVCVPPGESPRGNWPYAHRRSSYNHGARSARPQHPVFQTRSVALMATEVPLSSWRAFGFVDPINWPEGCGDDEDCPLHLINWYEAAALANARSDDEGRERCYELLGCTDEPGERMVCDHVEFRGLDCTGYRLPTEAEWERAFRSGTEDMGWRDDDEGRNSWGLTRSMLDAPYEWMQDVSTGYQPGPVIDPLPEDIAAEGHSVRVYRYAMQREYGAVLRGPRSADIPSHGLRLARTLGEGACNGVDDDSDGRVDEDTGVGLPCTVGLGVCANPEGRIECGEDGPRCVGVPIVDLDGEDEERRAEFVEICDEVLDNDCDGFVDENTSVVDENGEERVVIQGRFPVIGTCLEGVGHCRTRGNYVCQDGESVCSAVPLPGTPEVCDGGDNDCDGTADESTEDRDRDGRCEGYETNGTPIDNCPEHFNPVSVGRPGDLRQSDRDGDGIGDVCDREPDARLCGESDGIPCNSCPPGTLVPRGEWVCIPPGSFEMGARDDDAYRQDDERPRQRIEIPEPFIMQSLETSLGQWEEQMVGEEQMDVLPALDEPCVRGSDRRYCPIRGIDWFSAVAYVNRLSEAEGVPPEALCYELIGCFSDVAGETRCEDVLLNRPCEGYRLPDEAEWEYAALAGRDTRWWLGNSETSIADSHFGNSGGVVQSRYPNTSNWWSHWGLRRINGNVSEWTESWYGPYQEPNPDGTFRDPGPEAGDDDSRKVVRGGNVALEIPECRAADRHPYTPNTHDEYIGLRPVRAASRDPACLGDGDDICNGVDDDCDGRIDEDPSLEPGAVCTGGLLGHWAMDEGEGSAVQNAVTRQRGWLGFDPRTTEDGSTEEPDWIEGICEGAALRLDGEDDYVRVPYRAAFDTQRVTVSIWVRGDAPITGHLIARGSGGSCAVGSYRLSAGVDGAFFAVRTQSGAYSTASTGADWSSDGRWHHLVGTYDGASPRLYLDGVEVGGDVEGAGGSLYASLNGALRDIHLGVTRRGECGGLGPHLAADLDELRIWQRALTPGEVAALYEEPCNPPPMEPQCRPGAEPAPEVCNGLDDDCDGRADEGTETVSLGSFDDDAEGWSIVNLTSYAGHPGVLDAGTMTLGPGEVLHLADGGSPGGYIEAIDPSIEEAFQFSAPGEGLGRLRGSGGGVLRFRLRVSHFDDYWESAVHLVGARHALRHVIPSETFGGQADVWHSIEVPLLPSSFVMGVGDEQRPPTPSELEGVLRSPHALMLPGEWSSGGGPETTSIDSVEIERSICGGRE